MFLEIPIIIENEDTDEAKELTIDINPFHVLSIEPCPENKRHSLVNLGIDLQYEVCMTRKQLKKVISDFVKENVLSKLYKEIKDDSAKN